MLKIKRVYEPPARGDGARVLVDRLWPRGLRKTEVRIDLWLKEIAPSRALREWFGHDPAKWAEFKQRYFAELKVQPDQAFAEIKARAAKGTVTLLFGAKEERFNNAAALKEYLSNFAA